MPTEAGKKTIIAGAVEGLVDEVVLRRLIRLVGAEPGAIYGRHGKQFLQKNLAAYNCAAESLPWVVLVDLDMDAECAVPFRAAWMPRPAPYLCFRVAVREIEAWLLADRERLAAFLGVPQRMIPPDPEAVPDPKHLMVSLAQRSRERRLRHEMVPRWGSGRVVGPAYNARLIRFVTDNRKGWRPEVAAQESPSLRRALACLRRLAQTGS
jgi:hypothetical protein